MRTAWSEKLQQLGLLLENLPHFVETFHDDGCMDMYKVMKALREVRYAGSLMPDHIPQLLNDTGHRAGLAYCIAYMRALLRRANEEVG